MTEQSKSSRENKQSTRGVLSWSSQFYEISYSSSKQMSSKCAVQHGYAYKVARYSFGNRSSIIHKIAFVWISTFESLVFTCRATQWAHPAYEIHHRSRGVGGGGGKRGGMVSPRKSVVQFACQYDVTSRVGDFQNAEQSVHRRDG